MRAAGGLAGAKAGQAWRARPNLKWARTLGQVEFRKCIASGSPRSAGGRARGSTRDMPSKFRRLGPLGHEALPRQFVGQHDGFDGAAELSPRVELLHRRECVVQVARDELVVADQEPRVPQSLFRSDTLCATRRLRYRGRELSRDQERERATPLLRREQGTF